MQTESYAKPEMKTVFLGPVALCDNAGSPGGSSDQNSPGLFLISGGSGGAGGLNGYGGSTGEGPSAGSGGSGTH